MRRTYVVVGCLVWLSACAGPDRSVIGPSSEANQDMRWSPPNDGSVPHVMRPDGWVAAAATAPLPPSTSPDLAPGPATILLSTVPTYAIYWGSQWGTQPFTGDKETGITSLLQGFGGSSYLNILPEYYRSSLPHYYISTSSPYVASFTDNSTPPPGDLVGNYGVVGTEVCNVLSAHHVTPNASAVYFVYSTTTADVNACGWHYFGACGSTNIQFAYVLNQDTFTQCNTPSVAGHSGGLSRIANTTAHELAEAITDPRNSGWRDPQGFEIGDLCQGKFDGPGQSTTLSNGAVFALQDLWSNNANDQNYGFGDSQFLGGKGCVPAAPWSHVVTWFTSGNNPSQATIQYYCSWSASAAGGTPPYTYTWQAIGTNLFDTPNGSSVTVYKFDSGDYVLQLTVKDAKGQQAIIAREVQMTTFAIGNCSPVA